MCRPTTCKRCAKTTWSGCGNHVDQVMSTIPKPQQCTCTSKSSTPQRQAPKPKRLWFNR